MFTSLAMGSMPVKQPRRIFVSIPYVNPTGTHDIPQTNQIKHVSEIYVIPPQWMYTDSWNPSSCKTRTYIFYVVNIKGPDVLNTRSQGISNHDLGLVKQRSFFPACKGLSSSFMSTYTWVDTHAVGCFTRFLTWKTKRNQWLNNMKHISMDIQLTRSKSSYIWKMWQGGWWYNKTRFFYFTRWTVLKLYQISMG